MKPKKEYYKASVLPKGAQDALLEERQYGMVSYQFS
jgi:hypothetical protein